MWELDHKESWALKNWWFWTVVLEKTLESPLDCKEIQPVHPKGNQSCLSWNSNTLATPCAELSHWKILWCWERLKVVGEVDNRGWDGWMASPTQWRWFWVNSGSWWWTGRPGVLQSMESQRVRHDRATELNCNERWGPSVEKQFAHAFLHFTSHKCLVGHLDIVAIVTLVKPPAYPIPAELQWHTYIRRTSHSLDSQTMG